METIDSKYTRLCDYGHIMDPPIRDVLGREAYKEMILDNLYRKEMGNMIILGEAGSGKSTLVEAVAQEDTFRIYIELNAAKMLNDVIDVNQMSTKLRETFEDAILLAADAEKEVVLFMDEFHQIVHLAPNATEALKPLLIKIATKNVKFIAASTYEEYRRFISDNQALNERLSVINLREPSKEVCLDILQSVAEKYNIFLSDDVARNIYTYTNRHIPANSQPRKSILLLDAMIGKALRRGAVIDNELLAETLYSNHGVKVQISVDAMDIKRRLDEKVIAQDAATVCLEQGLQMCVAGTNDKEKPQMSFLFTGTTGTGKTSMAKELAGILFDDYNALVRFDMTEYALPESLERFRVSLTDAVWQKPNCVLLFDEMEKACSDIVHLFYQILDDGRLIDKNDREISFKNTYIIMTTNAGEKVFEDLQDYVTEDERSRGYPTFRALIRKTLIATTKDGNTSTFPPALLGRIGDVVPFATLDEDARRQIVLMKLEAVRDKLAGDEFKIDLEFDDRLVKRADEYREGANRLVNFIVLDATEEAASAGGVRGLDSFINSNINSHIARIINKHKGEIWSRKIRLDIEGDMTHENEEILKSKARLIVKEI